MVLAVQALYTYSKSHLSDRDHAIKPQMAFRISVGKREISVLPGKCKEATKSSCVMDYDRLGHL